MDNLAKIVRKISSAYKLRWALVLGICGLLSQGAAQTLYWDTNGNTVGAGATPTGTWNAANTNWTTNSAGTAATTAFANGRDTVFSAGTDAVNTFTVTVSGTRSVSSINVQEGTVTFSGGTINFNDSSPDFIVTTGLTTTVNSVISGTNGLAKSGNGLLTLAGSNTYTGLTTISAGSLRVSNANALGTTGTVVNSGGELQLSGGLTVTNEALSLAGSGSNGALVSFTGNNTWSGNVALTNNATIYSSSAGQTLTIGNASATNLFSMGSNAVTFDGPGDTWINSSLGVSGDTGGLVKNGTGKLTLYGYNTYTTGDTTVNAGSLDLIVGPFDPGIYGLNGNLTIGTGPANPGAAGTVSVNIATNSYANQLSPSSNVTINSDGILNVGASTGLGDLTLNGGQVSITTGRIISPTGNISSNANSAHQTSTISGGQISLAGPTNFTVGRDATLTSDLTISSVIAGGALTKEGLGVLTLSGTNTYSGATTVNAGTLQLGASNVISDSSALVIGSGGLVDVGWGHTETVASLAGSGVLDIKGGPFTVGDATNTTFSGVISDSGGFGTFVKQGTGTLTLSGANTYTGVTNINSGAIVASSNTALGSATFGNTIASGAALQLQNNISLSEGSFTVTGTGVGGTGAIRNLSGNNALAGTLNLGGNTTLTSDAGTLTASGQVSLGSSTFTINGTGNTTLSGDINGTGGLTKSGTGTLVLSGSTANSFSGALNVTDGTVALAKTAGTNAVAGTAINIGDGVGSAGSASLRLDASNQIANSTGLITINSDGALQMNNFSEGINTLAGTGLVDLSTSGYLTVGVNSGSSSFGGSITGTGTLEKTGAGTLTFTSNIAFAGTLTLSGGTLALSNSTLGANTLLVTANSTIDFAGASSLNLTNLTISAGVTLTVQNWANASDYFFTQNWTGATFNTTGAAPMNQITFTGFSANNTKWLSYDKQITPVPEPSTYGAVLIGSASLLLAWRRRRRKSSAGLRANVYAR